MIRGGWLLCEALYNPVLCRFHKVKINNFFISLFKVSTLAASILGAWRQFPIIMKCRRDAKPASAPGLGCVSGEGTKKGASASLVGGIP